MEERVGYKDGKRVVEVGEKVHRVQDSVNDSLLLTTSITSAVRRASPGAYDPGPKTSRSPWVDLPRSLPVWDPRLWETRLLAVTRPEHWDPAR